MAEVVGMATRSERLLPPFSKEHSLLSSATLHHPAAVQNGDKLIQPKDDPQLYSKLELETPKLDKVYQYLWLAGLPKPARPLHRQRLVNRTILITEKPDEHLVWHESHIFIKPLPEFLLQQNYWQQRICHDQSLHKSACGFLLTYVWLVSYQSDLRIAKEVGLLPANIEWESWVGFVEDLLNSVDPDGLQQVARRYHYGELRLTRLNTIYRFAPSVFSLHNLIFGFMPGSTWYKAFLATNFGWLLAVLVYLSSIFQAMQLGLESKGLHNHLEGAISRFAIAALLQVLMAGGMIFVICFVLFWYHLLSTLQYGRYIQHLRIVRMKNKC